MKKDHYSFDEIKEKFRIYMDLKESSITEEEYEEYFCDELMVLPKEIVDRIFNDIQFVLLSAERGKGNPACYVNLKRGLDSNKSGIIVLTPHFFGHPYIDKNGNQKQVNKWDQQWLLHEVAHHVLDHDEYKNKEDKDEKEKAADAQVREWLSQFVNSNEEE